MLAQFLAIAIIGQCGGFGCGSSSWGNINSSWGNVGNVNSSWGNVDGLYAFENNDFYTVASVERPITYGKLVGKSVFCRYWNTGLVRTKSYARARIWYSGRSGLVNVPIINGYAPTIQWSLNSDGMITTLNCDYGDKLPYNGGEITYGKPKAAEKTSEKGPETEPEKVKVEELLPVPSQETTPLPLTGDSKPDTFAK